MAKIKFSQAWVNRMTSEAEDDVIASGTGFGPPPSDEELSGILTKVSGENAVREMVRRKWFEIATHADSHVERGKALENFLFTRKPNRPAFSGATLFRRQARQRDLIEELMVLAWLCRVTDKAAKIKTPQFDPEKLIPRSIARLSKRDSGPRDAIDYLLKLGIKVVIESSLPGMRTDGASFAVPSIGPIIGLTLRFDRLDSFWFTLLHEVAHIVLHLRGSFDKVFVDSIEEEDSALSEAEAEADAFAKDSFVPRDAWLRSDAFRFGTESAIFSLAEKFEIHPAVVAGRLRFEKRKYQAFSELLGAGQVRNALMSE